MYRAMQSIVTSVFLAFPIVQIGCTQNGQMERGTASTADDSAPTKVQLCTGCGQIKGSAVCCQPGQVTCSKCGLVKGSPGCCKIVKGSTEPVFLCAKCGLIKGSEKCCQPGQPTCAKCGLVKGSPGCCKIKKAG